LILDGTLCERQTLIYWCKANLTIPLFMPSLKVRLSEDEVQKLAWLAKKQRTTPSGIVRQFINDIYECMTPPSQPEQLAPETTPGR